MRPVRNPMDRFAEKVQISDDCILYTDTVRPDGYCRFWDGSRTKQAHVAAYELFVEPVPAGALVCHTCDVRNCVNPDHLYVGTHKTNAEDMHARGRFWGRRKLSDSQVTQIQELLADGRLSQEHIGQAFGVSQITVSRIALGKRNYLSRIAA